MSFYFLSHPLRSVQWGQRGEAGPTEGGSLLTVES